MKGTVLIIDDQVEYARFLQRLLLKFHYKATAVFTGTDARTQMAATCPEVVLIDKQLPDADGVELLKEFKQSWPQTQFIVITGHGTIKTAIQSTRHGAVDFLTKPCENEEVLLSVDNAMNKRHMNEEIAILRQSRSSSSMPTPRRQEVKFKTTAMNNAMSLARRAAAGQGTVMIVGESGTGKERLARWIHNNSKRQDGPFFSINLAAIPQARAETELFGHEPDGSSAHPVRKKGVLELANGGTLLIDNIDLLDISLQANLLGVLEHKNLLRVGGETLVDTDVRLLVSSHKTFHEKVAAGNFLEELYFRINVLPIQLPPLRARKPDLPALVTELLEILTVDLGLDHTPVLSPDAMLILADYHWPGNIRELRNVLERTLMLGNPEVIGPEDIPLSAAGTSEWHYTVTFPETGTLHDVTREVTRRLVEEALRRGRTKQDAANLLGITRHALAHQMKICKIK